MSTLSVLRVAIVLLGAWVLLTPVPAEAQSMRRSGAVRSSGFRGEGFRRDGNFGVVIGLGGWGLGWGYPYGYGWPGYGWPGYGRLGYGSPYGFGNYGYGYPGFGYGYPGLGYDGTYQTIAVPGWAVGPTVTGESATPRMRSEDSASPFTGAIETRSVALNLPGEPAVIDVSLPDPAAQVWVQGAHTLQTGMNRQYVSPALTSGRDYEYSIRARWRDADGEIQLQQQNVVVQAGALVRVAFPTK